MADEELRLQALASYQVLDSEEEEQFNAITRLAAAICETKISVVTLIDRDRQWFKAKTGTDASETPREVSFCTHTIKSDQVLIVPDTLKHETFKSNPFVTDQPHIRFYAGAPLVNPEGYRLGALCVTGAEPKTLNPNQIEALQILSRQVSSLLELRRQSRALQQSNQTAQQGKRRYQTLVSLLPLGVIQTDESGEVTFVNQVWSELAGIPIEKNLGKEWLQAFHPDDRARVSDALDHAVETMEPFTVESRIARNQEIKWVELRFRAFPTEGQMKGCICTAQDISQAKQNQEKMRFNAERAEAATHAKTQLLANVSYEIRNPINIIAGMAHHLRETSLNDEQARLLSAIAISAKDLVRLMNDLSDLAQVEDGNLSIEVIPFEMHAAMTETFLNLKDAFERKKIALQKEIAIELKQYFLGDPSRVRQILHNLLLIALNHTQHGQITVKAKLIDGAFGIKQIQLEVIHPGLSLAEESTPQLRVGKGFDLSIAKQLAQLMNGKLKVESIESTATRYLLTLPLAATEKPTRDEFGSKAINPAIAPQQREKFRILLAEDNSINQNIIVAILKRAGYRCDVVVNGAEAVHAAESIPYSLILMDCQMPEMDGYQATAELRSKGFDIPIIAVTAHAFGQDRARVRNIGMNDCLAKPVDSDVLIATIDRWLITAQSRAAS